MQPTSLFVERPVDVIATTTLRDAEFGLEMRVSGELAWNRFLDRLCEQLRETTR